MSKNILLSLLLSLIIAGCNSNNNQEQNPNEQVGVQLYAGEGVVVGSGDYGDVTVPSSKLLTIKITNSGDAALQGPPVIDTANFSIIYVNNCDNILPKKSCQLKINFESKGKMPGLYSGNLNLGSVFVALSANVVDPNIVTDVSFSSGSSLDFGTLTNKQNVLKTITITNSGTAPINESIVLGSSFTNSYDTCSNKLIAAKKTCQVKLILSGAGKDGQISESLQFGGKTLALTGNVVPAQGSSVLGTPILTYSINSAPQNSYDFGSFTGSKAAQAVITLTNSGTAPSNVSTASLSGSPSFSVAFNQCSNISLAKNASCQIRVVFASNGLSLGNYSAQLSFGSAILNLNAKIEGPATYTPGLKLMTNIEESSFVTQQVAGCVIQVNFMQGPRQLLVRQNVSSLNQYNDLNSYFPPSPISCSQSGMRFSGSITFSATDIDMSAGDVLCRRTSGAPRGSVKISMDEYFQIGGCEGLRFISSTTQFSSVEITTGGIVSSATPDFMLGIGNSLFFSRRDSNGKSLYETEFLDSDSSGLPTTRNLYDDVKNLFGGSSVSISNFDVVNGSLVFIASTSSGTHAVIYNLSTKIFSVLISSLETNIWYKIPNGAIFFVRDSNLNKTFIYKTTDLVNLTKLPTAIYDIDTNTGNSVFSNAYEMNGFLYGRGNNYANSISKVNLSTGEQEIVYTFMNGFSTVFATNKMYIIEQINAGGSNDTSGKIYKISSSGVLTELYSNIKYYQSIVKDNAVIYLTTRNYNSGLARVDKINISNDALSTVTQDLHESGGCDIDTVIGIQAVNTLNHSLLYDCNGSGSPSRKIKALSESGVISTVIEGYGLYGSMSSYYDDSFYGPDYFKKFQAYKNSFIVTGYSDSLGTKMVRINSQNQGTVYHIDPNQGANDYNSPITIFKNNLFFGGNSNQGEAPVGTAEFEIYKLFEN